MFKLNKQKLKIVAVLVVSLFVTSILSKQIFWLNSPRISPQFIANVKNAPFYIKTLPSRSLAWVRLTLYKTFNRQAQQEYAEKLENMPVTTPPPSTIYSPLRTGVYAGFDEVSKKEFIKFEAGTPVTYQTMTYTDVDGTSKTVTFPLTVSSTTN